MTGLFVLSTSMCFAPSGLARKNAPGVFVAAGDSDFDSARDILRLVYGHGGVLVGGNRADIDGMQSFGALHDLEADRLAGLECLLTVHLDGRVVGEQVLISAVGQDESIAFGVVEPLDLTAEHADIPLQRTPSLEYHPLRLHAITDQAGRRRGIPDTHQWVFICCNTLLPLVKAIRRMAENSVKLPLASPFARP